SALAPPPRSRRTAEQRDRPGRQRPRHNARRGRCERRPRLDRTVGSSHEPCARRRRPNRGGAGVAVAGAEMSAIAELGEDRVVDGVYAVLRKERLRTRSGAPYLALELADSTGRISGRVWNDVELLDTRFAEGDAVHVLGRVEKFRERLQLEVRALEPADA